MPPGPQKALLFDIDGTLADTDALHLQAFNLVFGPYGHVFDHGRFTRELQGFSNASIGQRFLANEPPHGKPHPMPYLEGLRAVNGSPDLAVAFEDSRSGISPRPRRALQRWGSGPALATTT